MEKHFAALKLLDSDNDSKLTRTFSYSELPSSQRIYIKQSYYSENSPNLVRQYSYEQIFDKTSNIRQRNDEVEWQPTRPPSNFFESSSQQFCKSNSIIHTPKFIPGKQSSEIESKKIENLKPLNDSKFLLHPSVNTGIKDKGEYLPRSKSEDKEPTDIQQKQFNVTNDKNKVVYKDIKKKFRSLVAKKENMVTKKVSTSCCNFKCICIFSIFIGILALFLNLDSFIICDHTTLFSNASLELQQKVYGQRNAISNIISFLSTDTFYVKVLCLVGGTGVGKSYTVGIIAKNFPNKNGIFVYDPVLKDTIDMNALNSSRSNMLLIMENLKMKDIDFFSDTMSLLSKNKNKCITVLAVFNVKNINNYLERETSSVQNEDAISKAFDNTNIKFLIVPYKPLDDQVLEMCITEAARNSNMTLAQSQIHVIKQSLLFSNSGCKGAHSKVQVVGRG
nr:PREDICTED: uncharacterized protein LOC100879655 [Megachile rotundata]XP_012151905.1 PREDICTED: uncharacterized protein LOC100879655 [Megachile rotundata]